MDQHGIDQVSSFFPQILASNGAIELKIDIKLRKKIAIAIVNADFPPLTAHDELIVCGLWAELEKDLDLNFPDISTAPGENDTSQNNADSAVTQFNEKLNNLKNILAQEQYKALGIHIGKKIALKLIASGSHLDRVPDSIYGVLITHMLYCDGHWNDAIKAVELSKANEVIQGMATAEGSIAGQNCESEDKGNGKVVEEGEHKNKGKDTEEGGDESQDGDGESDVKRNDNNGWMQWTNYDLYSDFGGGLVERMGAAGITLVNTAINANDDLPGAAMSGQLFAIWMHPVIARHVETLKAKYQFDAADDFMNIERHTQWYVDQLYLHAMSPTAPASLEDFDWTSRHRKAFFGNASKMMFTMAEGTGINLTSPWDDED